MSHAVEEEDVPRSCLYLGEVMHSRLAPFRHRFAYRVFSMLLDLDEIDDLARRLRFFARNRFNLFAFHDADHGRRDGSPVAPWVRAELARAGLDAEDGRIFVHCFPRILGFVFNPLTTYFCHDRDGRLVAILYEVKNTFGEQHCYLIPVEDDGRAEGAVLQRCEKDFYVSPFIDMAATYRFRIKRPGERLSMLIRETVGDRETLVATHTGKRAALTDAALLSLLVRYPLLTLKVVAGIHWEALRLWLKGAKFHERPAPPSHGISVVSGHINSSGSHRPA